MNQPMIHPNQLAAALAGTNEAQDNNPHCPPESFASGVITGFSISEKFRSGLSMCVEYTVEASGRPDLLPIGAQASETVNKLADSDKNTRTRQQARLKNFLASAYNIPADTAGVDWVAIAVQLSQDPRMAANPQMAIVGRRFKVVTEAKRKAPTTGFEYVPKTFHPVG